MRVLKIYYHLLCLIKLLLYKVIYRNNIHFPHNSTFRIGFHVVIVNGGRIIIGKKVFFNNYCSVCARSEICIDEGTIFGENVKIYDHNHVYQDPTVPIKYQGYTTAPIHIGKHCWIGSNVTILKGVTIGDNCVIGAGCVIYKDVPANSVVINKQDLIIKAK